STCTVTPGSARGWYDSDVSGRFGGNVARSVCDGSPRNWSCLSFCRSISWRSSSDINRPNTRSGPGLAYSLLNDASPRVSPRMVGGPAWGWVPIGAGVCPVIGGCPVPGAGTGVVGCIRTGTNNLAGGGAGGTVGPGGTSGVFVPAGLLNDSDIRAGAGGSKSPG